MKSQVRKVAPMLNIWPNFTERMPGGTRWRRPGYLASAAVGCSTGSLLLYFPRVGVCLLHEVSSALDFLPLSRAWFPGAMAHKLVFTREDLLTPTYY